MSDHDCDATSCVFCDGKRAALDALPPWVGPLIAAVERGRELHPWESRGHSLDALREEVSELGCELLMYDGEPDSEERIRAEALDVAVVALRIWAGW